MRVSNRRSHYVYAIRRDSDQAIKVGFSHAPESRLLGLRHLNGKVELLHKEFCYGVHGVDVESYAHRLLANSALGQEWFAVSAEEAISAIKASAKAFNVSKTEPPTYDDSYGANASNILTGAQIRTAMAMAKLSPKEVGERAGLSPHTINRMKRAEGIPPTTAHNLIAVQRVLEDAGMVFFFLGEAPQGGPGVRLRG